MGVEQRLLFGTWVSLLASQIYLFKFLACYICFIITLPNFSFSIDIVMVVSFLTILLKRNTWMRMSQHSSCDSCSQLLSTCIQNRSLTGTSSHKTLCSIRQMIWVASKWLTLVYQKTTHKEGSCTRWVDLLTTWPPKYFCRIITQRLMFGPWGLYCTLCYQERFHSQEGQSLKLSTTWSRVSFTLITLRSNQFQMNARTSSEDAWSGSMNKGILQLRLLVTLGSKSTQVSRQRRIWQKEQSVKTGFLPRWSLTSTQSSSSLKSRMQHYNISARR